MSPLRQLSPLSQRIVGVVVLLMALMTVTSTAYYNHEQREITSCQTAFNEKFIDQINQRNEIAASERQDLLNLVKAVINSKSREESRRALENYVKAKEETDEERAKHPLPELPSGSASC